MNTPVIHALTRLGDYYALQEDTFRASTFHKAAKIIESKVNEPLTIDNYTHILRFPGIGEGVRKRVQEILQTGKLAEIKEQAGLSELTHLHGFGPAKARKLAKQGILTRSDVIKHVKAKTISLTHAQKIGLHYYTHLRQKIPRDEVTRVGEDIMTIIRDFYPEEKISIAVVGSYRRKAKESGDVDILFTASTSCLEDIVQYLKSVGFIQHTLSLGSVKFQGIYFSAYTPEHPREGVARKIDIRYVPHISWPTALLHATGSDAHNIILRKVAIELGYTLSEHGLFKVTEGKLHRLRVRKEEDIFTHLKLKYVPPENRK